MSKLIVIGIDGFDPILIKKWGSELANLKSLCDRERTITIKSTLPPDSICAWASIFTGKNPAEHGMIESVDYLSTKKKSKSIYTEKASVLKGNTFWDIASQKGKTVCVINPFLAYPAWEIQGMMISGPVFEGGDTTSYPDGILNDYEFPSLGGMVDFPNEKELDEFIIRTRELTIRLAEESLKIYKENDHDLFFVTFLTLDRIKHFLWRFTDKDDPYYPGQNDFENVVNDFYRLFDDIVGRFKDALKGDTCLLVISDHGHRRRCTKCLNLNEILRLKGYITMRNGIQGLLKKIVEKTKVFTIAAMSRCGLQDWIYKIAKFIPHRKKLKKSTYLIDKENSSAILSNLCGTNPYGGVDINYTKVGTPNEYEKVRTDIINELIGLNEKLGSNVVKWAKRREEIYTGKYEGRLPDILFELDGDYGVGLNFFIPVITSNHTHKKISGGHNREAVLLVYSNNGSIGDIERPDSIIGLKDYILKILTH